MLLAKLPPVIVVELFILGSEVAVADKINGPAVTSSLSATVV